VNPLALEFLTVYEASPPEAVRIAAELGLDKISLAVNPIAGLRDWGLLEDSAMRRETRQALLDNGVQLDVYEGFILAPKTQVARYRPAFEAAVALGGRQINVCGYDPDPVRLHDRFLEFHSLACEYQTRVLVEFVPFTGLPTLDRAVELIQTSGCDDVALTVDSLHFSRSGGIADQLRAIPSALIGRVQLSDAPLAVRTQAEYIDDGFNQRRIPGEGELPLVDFMRAIPPDVVVALEVPLRDLQQAGVPALERARRCVAGARDVMRRAAALS
jgi:sugar phosphate isomerase/epimerase